MLLIKLEKDKFFYSKMYEVELVHIFLFDYSSITMPSWCSEDKHISYCSPCIRNWPNKERLKVHLFRLFWAQKLGKCRIEEESRRIAKSPAMFTFPTESSLDLISRTLQYTYSITSNTDYFIFTKVHLNYLWQSTQTAVLFSHIRIIITSVIRCVFLS